MHARRVALRPHSLHLQLALALQVRLVRLHEWSKVGSDACHTCSKCISRVQTACESIMLRILRKRVHCHECVGCVEALTVGALNSTTVQFTDRDALLRS